MKVNFSKPPLKAEDAILRGGILDMEITQGPTKDMKLRGGHNKQEGKYYIQITHKKTLYSFRIFLTEAEFKTFIFGMQKTMEFTKTEDTK